MPSAGRAIATDVLEASWDSLLFDTDDAGCGVIGQRQYSDPLNDDSTEALRDAE